MTTHTIVLAGTKPPLSMNQRLHHQVKARITRQLRDEVHIEAKRQRLPRGVPHVTVTLHYRPARNGVRDTDNLVATLKPCCDALAKGTPKYPGYGLVEDDTPQWMTKPMPVIHPAEKGEPGSLWLEIELQENP